MKPFILSIDVEPDLHSPRGKPAYRSVDEGMPLFEKLCDRYGLKPILFVTADCIKHNPRLFKRLHRKGWAVSLHGFSHRRFDEMTLEEKEDELKKSIAYWVKYLQFRPRGFRAPQHSIDEDTLDLLMKYRFEYDSSYTPLNLLQLFFFPKKIGLWMKTSFSPLNPYTMRKNSDIHLEERPPSALVLPFVSLIVRVMPKTILRLFVWKLGLVYRKPHFYAHSWDFIEQKESRIDRMFPHTKFIENLELMIENSKA